MDSTAKPRRSRARKAAVATDKFIVLVGLMGAGKSNVGKRIASSMGLQFVDTDAEIESAADCTVEEIFEQFGEQYFRKGERRVIRRLFREEQAILATGGGAFMDPQTRKLVRTHGISVWLRADLDLLVKRTARRSNRPLLKRGNRREILRKLIEERHPVYSKADITVDVGEEPAATTAKRVIKAISDYIAAETATQIKT